ncbi:MAG: hypothetical protein NTW04_01390 [Elusimicrobia bacterium]|nr:hypothetical protein [Elusimicrobiota bacterium]
MVVVAADPEFAKRAEETYKNEILISEGGKNYWMPIQTQVLKYFTGEEGEDAVKENEKFILFARFFGVSNKTKSGDPFLLMIDYEKISKAKYYHTLGSEYFVAGKCKEAAAALNMSAKNSTSERERNSIACWQAYLYATMRDKKLFNKYLGNCKKTGSVHPFLTQTEKQFSSETYSKPEILQNGFRYVDGKLTCFKDGAISPSPFFCQTLAGIKRGDFLFDVERAFGKPTEISKATKSENRIYPLGKDAYLAVDYVEGKATSIQITGSDPNRPFYFSGITLGDEQAKFVKFFGPPTSVESVKNKENVELWVYKSALFSIQVENAKVRSIKVWAN